MAKVSTRGLTLFHGSPVRVEQPQFGLGNPHNDYGLGFYCTQSRELASEWTCPGMADGYVNEYLLATEGLRFLDLDAPEYSVLNWLAVLVANRSFDATTPLMVEAKEFLLKRHLVSMEGADVVMGHRADDSYFSFARAFLDNRLSVRQLELALKLGGLGQQIMLKSSVAFTALSFVDAQMTANTLWHPRRCTRDEKARMAYRNTVITERNIADDVFMVDLLRGV